MHIDATGAALNSKAGELLLEGQLRVGYARVLELRKLSGKRRMLRQSVRAADASITTAVVLPLVEGPRHIWTAECSKARPLLVPVLSLGRRVVAEAATGVPTAVGGLKMKSASAPAGGKQLQAATLTPALFAAAAMVQVKQDLVKMKVAELKDELTARGEHMSLEASRGSNGGCIAWQPA
jgi:hypothetical protein